MEMNDPGNAVALHAIATTLLVAAGGVMAWLYISPAAGIVAGLAILGIGYLDAARRFHW